MGLRYYAPADSLRGVISSYYVFHVDLPDYVDLMRADLPQLRFMLAGSARYHFADGRIENAPDICLVGPTYGAYRVEVKGPLQVFGIGLLPAGWAALLRTDASELADHVVDAEAVMGGVVGQALESLRQMNSPLEMVNLADAMFGKMLEPLPQPFSWFTRLADEWLTSSASPVVDKLITATTVSGRQVERLTKRIYGAPPKLLARKYRALKAAAVLAKGGTHWSDVAGDAFSDQSHFIREFREFIGITPNQLIANPPPVTRLTLERRRMNGVLPKLTKIT
jgi:AraC-like DNA-binding protein